MRTTNINRANENVPWYRWLLSRLLISVSASVSVSKRTKSRTERRNRNEMVVEGWRDGILKRQVQKSGMGWDGTFYLSYVNHSSTSQLWVSVGWGMRKRADGAFLWACYATAWAAVWNNADCWLHVSRKQVTHLLGRVIRESWGCWVEIGRGTNWGEISTKKKKNLLLFVQYLVLKKKKKHYSVLRNYWKLKGTILGQF